MKRIILMVVMALVTAVCSGCAEMYYGASNAAAMLTPLADASWVMRLSSVLHGDIQIAGGFAGDGVTKVSLDQTFPFKGAPGEAFQGKAPMVVSIDWGGQRREVVIPLQELVKQPIQGEFRLDVTAEGIDLSVRKYTGGKVWSPGTGIVSHEMQNPVALFSASWHRVAATN